ncbi:methyltransferase [Spongisporangium articulatum]|uniref:Methyltransferase n=1 Tax=Spongisporangium articulatum TaxID=3362603 RepID=A0ABW8AJZ3_9ACTN
MERLRADLSGFTVDAVEGLLGPLAVRALSREQATPALAVTAASDDPVATLLRVFVLGEQVPRRRLAAALPKAGLDTVQELGWVLAAGEGDDDPVRAVVDLRPYGAVDGVDGSGVNWWVLSDPGELALGGTLPADHVLGVGGASVTLAACTVRSKVGRVLDLGTGCGVQSLHAARHARSIVATDISVRALDFAALTWLLNAPTLGGAEFDRRKGDLFDPVQGERFDLVVSNPPFVITPRAAGVATYEYRDAGLVGDEVVRRIVTRVGEVLAPGGVAQLLGNWEHRRGEGWRDRVESWLTEAGLDGWVVQREVQDPAEYAETWIRDAGQHRADGAGALYDAWLADFASRDVEAVGFGLITLRRPLEGEPTLRRLEERRDSPALPSGAEVVAALAAHDWLHGRDDESLLGASLTVAPDVTEERHFVPGAQDPTAILLRQNGGPRRLVQASTALAGLVGACGGELSVGQIVNALGALLERPEGELREELLPAVRSLIQDGLLLTS